MAKRKRSPQEELAYMLKLRKELDPEAPDVVVVPAEFLKAEAEPMLVHRRKLDGENETLCGQAGAKIYLSSRVTCSRCRQLMSESNGQWIA